MPADDFQKHVAGLAVRRLEKPKNLKEQCQKYWDEILSYQYHFNRGEGGKEGGRGIGRKGRKGHREKEEGGV